MSNNTVWQISKLCVLQPDVVHWHDYVGHPVVVGCGEMGNNFASFEIAVSQSTRVSD